MAAYARVSRDILYSKHLDTDSTVHLLPSAPNAPMETGSDNLTWQQRQAFGNIAKPQKSNNNRNRKWQKLDLEADTRDSGATIASWSEAEAIVSIQDLGSRSTRAHAPSSFHFVGRPATAEPTPPPSTNSNDNKRTTHRKPFNHRKKRRHKLTKNPEMTVVATLPPSAYIPPHRKRPTLEAKQGAPDVASNGLNPKGDQVQVPNHSSSKDQAQSPPNSPDRRPTSPPSPSIMQKQESFPGRGESKPEPPAPQRPMRSNPRWPARAPKPVTRHVWPKNRDMRPLPSQDESDGGGIGFRSDSNGDPDYDVKKLIQWNGDWMPPPEQWSARNSFTNRHFGATIEKWIEGQDKSCKGDMAMNISSVRFQGQEVEGVVLIDGEPVGPKVENSEVAPRTWIPHKLEGDSLRQFWLSLPSRAPGPLSDIDLTEGRPWWELYLDDDCYLVPLPAPETSIDPSDVDNYKPGAKLSATEALRKIESRKQERQRKLMEKRNRPAPSPPFPVPTPPDTRIRPTVNMYVRPVVPADARGVMEIYNWYIENTAKANEFTPRSPNHMAQRIHSITTEGLPFLVAVAKGSQLQRTKQGQGYVAERIIGFVYLDDFCDRGSMFRYSFELEFYTHPGFVRQGVASCLLDKLLMMANTGYNPRGGYEYSQRGEYLKHGSLRVIKSIGLNVPFVAKDDIEWMNKWLKGYGFSRRGHWQNMGYKRGSVVDINQYQHLTTEEIDPHSMPQEPL